MSQQHAERCQYDVVPVISDANGPAVQNVTDQCSIRQSYAAVSKTPPILYSSHCQNTHYIAK